MFGLKSNKDVDALRRVLNPSPSPLDDKDLITVREYITRHPDKAEYHTSKRGTEFVRVQFPHHVGEYELCRIDDCTTFDDLREVFKMKKSYWLYNRDRCIKAVYYFYSCRTKTDARRVLGKMPQAELDRLYTLISELDLFIIDDEIGRAHV